MNTNMNTNMNTTPFPGSGIRMAPPAEQVGGSPDFSQEGGSWRESDDAFADAVQGALSGDLSKMAVDEGTFKSGAEQRAWEAAETRARQRYHEERAKAAQQSKPPQSVIVTKRELLQQHIAAGRAAITAQQAIASAALENIRQLKVAVRCDEDALDGLLVSTEA